MDLASNKPASVFGTSKLEDVNDKQQVGAKPVVHSLPEASPKKEPTTSAQTAGKPVVNPKEAAGAKSIFGQSKVEGSVNKQQLSLGTTASTKDVKPATVPAAAPAKPIVKAVKPAASKPEEVPKPVTTPKSSVASQKQRSGALVGQSKLQSIEPAIKPIPAKPEAAKPPATKPEAAKPPATKPEAAKPVTTPKRAASVFEQSKVQSGSLAVKPPATKPEAAKPVTTPKRAASVFEQSKVSSGNVAAKPPTKPETAAKPVTTPKTAGASSQKSLTGTALEQSKLESAKPGTVASKEITASKDQKATPNSVANKPVDKNTKQPLVVANSNLNNAFTTQKTESGTPVVKSVTTPKPAPVVVVQDTKNAAAIAALQKQKDKESVELSKDRTLLSQQSSTITKQQNDINSLKSSSNKVNNELYSAKLKIANTDAKLAQVNTRLSKVGALNDKQVKDLADLRNKVSLSLAQNNANSANSFNGYNINSINNGNNRNIDPNTLRNYNVLSQQQATYYGQMLGSGNLNNDQRYRLNQLVSANNYDPNSMNAFNGILQNANYDPTTRDTLSQGFQSGSLYQSQGDLNGNLFGQNRNAFTLLNDQFVSSLNPTQRQQYAELENSQMSMMNVQSRLAVGTTGDNFLDQQAQYYDSQTGLDQLSQQASQFGDPNYMPPSSMSFTQMLGQTPAALADPNAFVSTVLQNTRDNVATSGQDPLDRCQQLILDLQTIAQDTTNFDINAFASVSRQVAGLAADTARYGDARAVTLSRDTEQLVGAIDRDTAQLALTAVVGVLTTIFT